MKQFDTHLQNYLISLSPGQMKFEKLQQRITHRHVLVQRTKIFNPGKCQSEFISNSLYSVRTNPAIFFAQKKFVICMQPLLINDLKLVIYKMQTFPNASTG